MPDELKEGEENLDDDEVDEQVLKTHRDINGTIDPHQKQKNDIKEIGYKQTLEKLSGNLECLFKLRYMKPKRWLFEQGN